MEATMELHFPADTTVLSGHELKCACTAVLGYRPSKNKLRALFPPNGAADRSAFVVALSAVLAAKEEDRKLLFSAFDVRRKGFLIVDDLLEIFAEVRPDVPEVIVRESFRCADRVGAGRLSFKAFDTLMLEAGGVGS